MLFLNNSSQDQRQIKLALEKDRDDLTEAVKKISGDDKDCKYSLV